MKTLRLKSRVGPVEFTRRTKTIHPNGTMSYEMRTYRFGFDNDFRQEIPSDVWESLKGEFLDRSTNLKYSEALLEL